MEFNIVRSGKSKKFNWEIISIFSTKYESDTKKLRYILKPLESYEKLRYILKKLKSYKKKIILKL